MAKTNREQLLLGWLAGRLMAAHRSSPLPVTTKYNFLDCSGSYISKAHQSSYMNMTDIDDTDYDIGKFPLTQVASHSYPRSTISDNIETTLNTGVLLNRTDSVTIKYIFPEVALTGNEWSLRDYSLAIHANCVRMDGTESTHNWIIKYNKQSGTLTSAPEYTTAILFDKESVTLNRIYDGDTLIGFIFKANVSATPISSCDIVLTNTFGGSGSALGSGTTTVTYSSYDDFTMSVVKQQVLDPQPIFLDSFYFNGSSSGRAFDTGVVCNQDTMIEVTVKPMSNSAYCLYGVTSNDESTSVKLTTGSSTQAWKFGTTSANVTTSKETKYTITVNKECVKRGATTYQYASAVDDFVMDNTLVLGAERQPSGAISSSGFYGYVYSFKIYDGDTLILDWVPTVSLDRVVGFYDKVSDTFIAPM